MELVDSDALRAESTPHLAENVPQALATGNWQHVVSDSHKGVFFTELHRDKPIIAQLLSQHGILRVFRFLFARIDCG